MPSNRRLTTLAGAVFVGAATTAMFAAPASAHAATVSGEAQCATDGTYTIHWTIQNKRFGDNKGWTLTLKNVSPASLKDDQGTALEGHEIAPNGSLTFDQKNVPGTDTSAKLSFNATWSDEWPDESTYSGSVTLGGDCKKEVPPPPPPTKSASPSAKPSASGTAGGETSPTPSKSTTAPALPVTGSQTGLLAGGAVVLLGAGAGLYVTARRRRLRFEA